MAALGLVAIAVVLTGCDRNYSGNGNGFKILATLDHAGKNSVTVRNVQVLEAYGKARKWFHGKHQIHDNYNTCDFTSNRHRVGNAYDTQRNLIRLKQIPRGSLVEITGSIRENASSCGKQTDYSWRPVFDYLNVKEPQ